MPSKLITDINPKMVSMAELRSRLLPLMQGISWAEDALMDLWRMGAPDPSPASRPCPPGVCERQKITGRPCGKWGCAREKRLLLPTQFATWWADVAKRQGIDLTAGQALQLPRTKRP